MDTIEVDIVSAEGQIFSGPASMVFLPGSEGELGVAPRHAPLLSLLKAGEGRVRTPDGEEQSFFVGCGVLEIQPKRVSVLADTAARAKDLDEAEAQASAAAGHYDALVLEAHWFAPVSLCDRLYPATASGRCRSPAR